MVWISMDFNKVLFHKFIYHSIVFYYYYVHSMLLLFFLLHKHDHLKRWWSRVEV